MKIICFWKRRQNQNELTIEIIASSTTNRLHRKIKVANHQK
jgi:hypothetical protein